MSDFFKGITFPWQEVTPADDAIVRKAILPDRRLSGCELSYSGYTLTMTAGVMIVCGRQFRHTAAQNWAVTGAASGYARLLLTIDTTKASTEDAFEQISVSVEYATASNGFPELRQNDINNAGTVYQTSICVVALGPGGITGFTGQIIPEDNVFHPGRLVSMDGHRVTGVGSPEQDGDAVNLGYAKKVGNPHNLLDNSDFSNPVNQRGRLSYDAYGYTIDRWIINGGSVSVENGYVTNSGGMIQRLPKHTANAVYTFACKNVDGTIEVLSNTFESNASNNSAQMSIGASSGLPYIHLLPGSYLWAALYEGEYTAKTLPEYQPKGYGVELMECQRYYQHLNRECIGNGYTTATGNSAIMYLPFTMRIPNPTIIYTDFVCRANGVDYVCDTIYSADADNKLYLACTAPGIPVKYAASFYSNNPIALSADL